MKKGLFITLEGPDGSGKSTIASLLKEHFVEEYDCILTREPGGVPISEDIRDILLDNDNTELSSRTEALLYAAARSQHVDELIKPAVNKGMMVISDRYVLSSLAYQGYARELGIETIMDINEFAMGNTHPDIVLFFDIDAEEALSRKFINREGDRLENAGVEFHNKTYEGYQKSIEIYGDNVVKVDANGTVEETLANCISAIKEEMKNV